MSKQVAVSFPDRLPYELTGSSSAVADCLAQLERVAADERHVLLTAERGLEAESVARAVHARSTRRDFPFVVLEAAAGPTDLEREMFGTLQRKPAGDLEQIAPASALYRANRGVLFLGNVNELPAAVQRRLARVLRDGEVRVRRQTESLSLDVRLIGLVESDLDGGVRPDLARRFPLVLHVPALRERRDDVPAIAGAMLAKHSAHRQFTPAALTVLSALPWRRNTAELASLIHRLAAAGGEQMIRQEDVLAEVQLDRAPVRAVGSLRAARRQFERDYIAAVLRDHEWQMRAAARALGIERANLYRKARQLGIPLRREAETVTTRTTR
jgi:two-component system nitrogen regulation response regulator NtrX